MKKSHKKFVVRKGIKGFQKMKPDEGSQAHGQPPKPQARGGGRSVRDGICYMNFILYY